MLNATPSNLTPAKILTNIVRFATKVQFEENRSDFVVYVIIFHDELRETSFIFFQDPDEFMEEVSTHMHNGWRPIAIEAAEDEEKDFKDIALEYLIPPTIEDEAIVEGMFESSFSHLN